MAEPNISVVVPAYNCEKTIARTLDAIIHQNIPNRLIVVDDGSTDETSKIIQSYPEVTYISQNNAGPAAARNKGAEQTDSEFVFFTDSDCIPKPDWLEKALKGFQKESVAVVAGSYGIANNDSLLARCIHQEIMYRHHHLMPEYPQVFGSYNFGVRRKVFENIGGFDSAYRFASGEDNDLSYKILRSGFKIFFEKNALVDHTHTDQLGKYLKEQFRHGFWRMKMYREHPQMIQGDNYTFWKDMVEVPLVLLIIGSGAFAFFAPELFLSLGFLSVVFLYILQLYFSFRMLKNLREVIFYSFVMFLRASSRTLGFSSGFLQFFLPKIGKKN